MVESWRSAIAILIAIALILLQAAEATKAPTKPPTKNPTKAPTKAPTSKSPTLEPTVNPSQWENQPVNTRVSFPVQVDKVTFLIDAETFFDTDDFSTKISITSSRDAWIGVMVGTRMVGSLALVGLDPTNSVNAGLNLNAVGLYNLVSEDLNPSKSCIAIVDGLEQNGITDASFAVIDGKSILNFTILASASSAIPLIGTEAGNLVEMAFVTGQTQEFAYHDAYVFLNAAFSTDENGATVATTPVRIDVTFALTYHIIFMIIAWIFLLPCGAFFALSRRRHGPKATGGWFKYHRGLQILGVLIGFGGWISGIVHVDQFGTPHLSKGHHFFGYAIGVFALVQLVNGLMRPHAPEKGEEPTKSRKRWFLSHRVLAWILLLSGITNSIVGAKVLEEVFGGPDTILVFPSAAGISVETFYLIVLVLGIISYLSLFIGLIVDPCRRRREGPEDSQYPEKPVRVGDDGGAPIQPPPRTNFMPFGGADNEMQNNQYGGGMDNQGGSRFGGFMNGASMRIGSYMGDNKFFGAIGRSMNLRSYAPFRQYGRQSQMAAGQPSRPENNGYPQQGMDPKGGFQMPDRSMSPPSNAGYQMPDRSRSPPPSNDGYQMPPQRGMPPPPNNGFQMPERSMSPPPNSGFQMPERSMSPPPNNGFRMPERSMSPPPNNGFQMPPIPKQRAPQQSSGYPSIPPRSNMPPQEFGSFAPPMMPRPPVPPGRPPVPPSMNFG